MGLRETRATETQTRSRGLAQLQKSRASRVYEQRMSDEREARVGAVKLAQARDVSRTRFFVSNCLNQDPRPRLSSAGRAGGSRGSALASPYAIEARAKTQRQGRLATSSKPRSSLYGVSTAGDLQPLDNPGTAPRGSAPNNSTDRANGSAQVVRRHSRSSMAGRRCWSGEEA